MALECLACPRFLGTRLPAPVASCQGNARIRHLCRPDMVSMCKYELHVLARCDDHPITFGMMVSEPYNVAFAISHTLIVTYMSLVTHNLNREQTITSS